MRKQILPLLGKVWRKEITPEQVVNLLRAGPFNLTKEKRKRILEILSALQDRELESVNEADEALEEEGVYEKTTENLCCQI